MTRGRVYAEDKDENQKITYSIVSTDDKFSIDPETGWLSTNAVRVPLKLELISSAGNFSL